MSAEPAGQSVDVDAAIAEVAVALAAMTNMKREELAPVLGLSRAVIFTRLNGSTSWKASEVAAMADYFNIEPALFFGGHRSLLSRLAATPPGPPDVYWADTPPAATPGGGNTRGKPGSTIVYIDDYRPPSVARPKGFEPPTFWSIECLDWLNAHRLSRTQTPSNTHNHPRRTAPTLADVINLEDYRASKAA